MKNLVIFMITAMIAASAGAAVINVNMYASSGGYKLPEDPATLEGPAGGLGQTWNQFNTTTGSDLLDSTGAVTTVGFSNNVSSGWGVDATQTELTALKSSRSHFGKGTDTTHTITGLEAGGLYNIWIASYNRNASDAERALGEWSTSNPTTTVGPQMIDGRGGYYGSAWEYGVNYVMFENVKADASGQIVLIGDACDGAVGEPEYGAEYPTRLHLNAFQIADVVLPSDPSPGDNDTIAENDSLSLSWTNIDPNTSGGVTATYVDVWFGTDPCGILETETWSKIVAGQDVETAANVNASGEKTYYWRVDSYIEGDDDINEPNRIEGIIWKFNTTSDVPPTGVSAGNDVITWVGKETQLNGSYTDDGSPALLWTSDSADAVLSPSSDGGVTSDTEDPTVTVSSVGNVTLTFTVDDGYNPPVEKTVVVEVYADACAAAKAKHGADATELSDLNADCVTNLLDFALMAEEWLLDTKLPGPVDK